MRSVTVWVKASDSSGRLLCLGPHLTLPYPNLTFYYYAPLIYIWKRGQSMLLCVKAQLTNWGQLPELASWCGWVTQTSAKSSNARWRSSPLVTFTHDHAWCRQISTCLIFIARGVKRFWPWSRSKFGNMTQGRGSQVFSTFSGSVPSVDPLVFFFVGAAALP